MQSSEVVVLYLILSPEPGWWTLSFIVQSLEFMYKQPERDIDNDIAESSTAILVKIFR